MTDKFLQKYLAEAGFCSRRQAEALIKKGQVTINGKVPKIGDRVCDKDKVQVNKELIKPETEKFYLKLNKPRGYVCTNRSFSGEKNVFDLVSVKTRLFVVGRLDKDSHGLVILTNDGDWAHKMTHPSFEKEKEYLVKVASKIRLANTDLKKMVKANFYAGIDIGQGDGIAQVKSVDCLAKNVFKIILTQGKKRQIKRMFQALDLEVIDLQRVRIGNLKLGDLKLGEWTNFKN